MEQIQKTDEIENAQTAAAEEVRGVVNDKKPFTGKFASVDALYKAYERLEAEFTRRSQRLKTLEAGARNELRTKQRRKALRPVLATAGRRRAERAAVRLPNGRTAT